jgi:hypothetical protein
MPNAILVLLAYLLGSWLLSRAGLAAPQQLKEEIVETVASRIAQSVPGVTAIYDDIDDPPWRDLFDASKQVEIVARFFDGITRNYYRSIVSFFRRSGSMRIITLDPRNEEAISVTNIQRNTEQAAHVDNVLDRWISTLKAVDKARIEAGSPVGSVRLFLLPYATNYTAYCFDGKNLLLNSVEHFFLRIYRSPRILLDLRSAESVQQFWQHEMEATQRHAVEVADIGQFIKELQAR